MKFSLILPVYNVEKYLDKCMESIMEQTYSDFEVILVNDGSKDNSLSLCQDYANLDERVKVINKENGGVSSARNEGIKQATGEWIVFIDPDDWIESQCIEKCAQLIEKNDTDMLCYNAIKAFETNNKFVKLSPIEPNWYEIEGIEKNELMYSLAVSSYRKHFYAGELIRAVWGKALKRDIIVKNRIEFDKQLSHGEDCVFLMEYLLHCKKISLANEYLYYYRIREGSAVNTGPKNFGEIYSYQFFRISKLINENVKDKEKENVLLACKLGCVRGLINGLDSHKGIVEQLRELKMYINSDWFQSGKYSLKNHIKLHKREELACFLLYYKIYLGVLLVYRKRK